MTLHQLNMDDIWSRPAARNTDPVTSRMAAEKAALGASRGRLLVLQNLAVRAMTDFELADATGWIQPSIGKRRHECQMAGFVRRALDGRGEDVRRATPSGCSALVWEITPDGREYLQQHE